MKLIRHGIVCLSQAGMALTAITFIGTLLSVCAGFGIAVRVAAGGVGGGLIEICGKTDSNDRDYKVGIFSGVHAPEFRWERPAFEKGEVWGLRGLMDRYWVLRIPLWLALLAVAVPSGALCGLARIACNERFRGWRETGRGLLVVAAGLISALLSAWILSALVALFPEGRTFWDIAYRVILPLITGTVVGIWMGRRVSRMQRRGVAEVGHCLKCGYDLTGNVSGRCPECSMAIPRGDKHVVIQ